MNKLLFVTSLVLIFKYTGVIAKVLPDYIKPCPGLKSDCLKKTIQETIPLFVKGLSTPKLEPLDPLLSDHISLTLPGGLKVELSEASATGLRKCIVDDVKYDNGVADLKFHCNVTLKAKYKANGRVLIVSINGDGDAKIKLLNIIITSRIYFHDVTRDGIVYHEIKKYDVNYHIGDRVTFSLTNLFKGNPELSETVLAFLNENWKQLLDEFGKPVFDQVVELVYNVISKFFMGIPKSEIFFD